MNADNTKCPGIPLTVFAFALGLYSVHALEPQTLHNFELSPGEVTASLIVEIGVRSTYFNSVELMS
jgi:hypothetical protein